MRLTPPLVLAILVLLLAGCAPGAPAPTSLSGTSLPHTTETAPSDTLAPAAVPPPTDELARLRAHSWQWVALEAAGGQTEIKNPAAYRLTFNTDATLGIVADCAGAGGSYQGEAGKLQIDIETGGQNCRPDSQGGELLAALAAAVRYTFDGERLRVGVGGGSGNSILVFEPAASPAPVPTAAAGGASR